MRMSLGDGFLALMMTGRFVKLIGKVKLSKGEVVKGCFSQIAVLLGMVSAVAVVGVDIALGKPVSPAFRPSLLMSPGRSDERHTL